MTVDWCAWRKQMPAMVPLASVDRPWFLRSMSGDDFDKFIAVFFQLSLADAVNVTHLLQGGGQSDAHLLQGLVTEHNVGWHVLLVG